MVKLNRSDKSIVGTNIKFVEWSADIIGSVAKELHEEPAIGFSCIIDPQYGRGYTWLTTPITEIISDTVTDNIRCIEFNTKNSYYELQYSI